MMRAKEAIIDWHLAELINTFSFVLLRGWFWHIHLDPWSLIQLHDSVMAASK